MISTTVPRPPLVRSRSYSHVETKAEKNIISSCNENDSRPFLAFRVAKEAALIDIESEIKGFLQKYRAGNKLTNFDETQLKEILKKTEGAKDLEEICEFFQDKLKSKEFTLINPRVNLLLKGLIGKSQALIIQHAIQKINNSPESKTSYKILDIIFGIQNTLANQENTTVFLPSNDLIEDDVKKLQGLGIEGLCERKACQGFIYAIYYSEQHREDPLCDNIVKFEKFSIERVLERIGYVDEKEIKSFPFNFIYSGFTKSDKPHGYGVAEWFEHTDEDLKFESGEYKGSWKNGEKHGFGSQEQKALPQDSTLKSGYSYDNKGNSLHYIGDWKDGKRHGFGSLTLILNSKTQYQGEWKNHQRDGIIFERKENGESFLGPWKEDNRLAGVWIVNKNFYDGRYQYQGFFLKLPSSDTLLGQLMWQGIGVLKYPNGDQYYGHVYNKTANGFGIIRYADGREFEGYWDNGELAYAPRIPAGVIIGSRNFSPDRSKRQFEWEKNKIPRDSRIDRALFSSNSALIPDLANIVIEYYDKNLLNSDKPFPYLVDLVKGYIV